MAFSNTMKCPECGTVYYKGNAHVCPVPCPDCGIKVYSDTHSCDPKRVEEFLLGKFKKEMESGKQVELTPRMQRRIEFLRWCEENGRP